MHQEICNLHICQTLVKEMTLPFFTDLSSLMEMQNLVPKSRVKNLLSFINLTLNYSFLRMLILAVLQKRSVSILVLLFRWRRIWTLCVHDDLHADL